MGWQDKRCCASSHCEDVRLFTEHMPMVTQYLDALSYLSAMRMSCYYMIYLIHATPVHPSLCLQYFHPAVSYIHCAIFISLLLLLFHYCCCFKTVTADKPLQTSPLSGAGELTTHFLRLANILWLPLCQINKFWFYFPRRLLRSLILMGHRQPFQ